MLETGLKAFMTWVFYIGPALTVTFLAIPWVLRDRRIRFLMITMAFFVVGIELVFFFAPHYAAPLSCVILAVLVQALRHLRGWRWHDRPIGAFLARSSVLICVLMVPIQVVTLWGRARSPNWKPEGVERERILRELSAMPGNQLVIVRYRPDHDVLSQEWVYNEAGIDNSKVVWARDMGPTKNEELVGYFEDRHVWLVEPDFDPPRLTPYPVVEKIRTH